MNSSCSFNLLNYIFKIFILSSAFIFSTQFAYAESPNIIDFKLNGKAENITFNPNNSESISIDVKANRPVKFTRLYICSVTQACTGSSGNYTRYFTQSFVSDTISKIWNGKTSGDAGLAPSGEYKVMVSMTEESGGTAITAFGESHIFLDFTAVSSSTSDTGEVVDDANDHDGETIDENIADISTHSSTEGLSSYKDSSAKLKVSAGRERLAYVGLPIELSASINLSQNDANFEWSFGDGYKQSGKRVYHTYKAPGEYVVILNGINGEESSVSRTQVTVLEPSLNLEVVGINGISIKNTGKFEINIGGLKFQKGFETFDIAKDTIIMPGNTITLPEVFKNSDSGVIYLKTVFGETISSVNIKKNKTAEEAGPRTVNKDEIISDVNELNNFISAFKKIPVSTNVQIGKPQITGPEILKDEKITAYTNNSQPAAVLEAISNASSSVQFFTESQKDKAAGESVSLWRKILSAPKILYRNIKYSFYEAE